VIHEGEEDLRRLGRKVRILTGRGNAQWVLPGK
jgi:hypothetical protein